MHRNVVRTIIDGLVVIIITITAVFLWINKLYFVVPDSDIFQYIDDGRQYLQLKLPRNIQTPPINAILIESLAKLLRSHEYSEILSAHIINIVATIITMCLLYLLIRSYSRTIGALVIVLLATNPLFIFQSLNVTSEVLFTTAIILSLLLYRTGRLGGAYIVAACSFLIRYEGLILLISMVALDGLRHKNVHNTIRMGLLALIPVFLWLIIINYSNPAGSVLGNNNIQEMVTFHQRIPQFGMITRLPFNLLEYVDAQTFGAGGLHTIVDSLFYFMVLAGTIVIVVRKEITLRIVYLNTLLYVLFHMCFPFVPDRYLYPVAWTLYLAPLLGAWVLVHTMRKKQVFFKLLCQVVCVGLALFVAEGNLQRIVYYYRNETAGPIAFPRNSHLEIRMAADWLNKTKFEQPVMIFVYEPWILSYYTKNIQVSFFSAPYITYQQCNSVECLIKSGPSDAANYRILIIQQSNSLLVDSSFPSAANLNVHIFNQFPNEEEKNHFVLLAQLNKYDSWAKIYQFLPNR